MNKLFTFFIILINFNTNAQIVINEIMYNPPESNTDFLEYIELYNPTNANINLKDYRISEAFSVTFPDTIIPADGYFLVCVNSFKFDSVFGIKAMQWTSNNLNNTSERITLTNAAGAIIDSVRYFDIGNGWNPKADGDGYSLELCRPNVDNSKGEFWKISNSNTGITIEGKPFYGSPGKMNLVPCAEHIIAVSNFKFSPSSIEIQVGDFVEWQNIGGSHNINGTQAIFPQNPESFGNGAVSSNNWTYLKQFNIAGTYQYQCDPHAGQMQGTVIVKEKNSSLYPIYPIAKVTTNNSNGEVDSINVNCQLDGVVYGVNLRAQGLQFTLIDDSNDGIAVFSSTKSFGYSVKEGDKISVRGRISQFQGLTQILLDTLLTNGTGILKDATEVNFLNETTESQLVVLKNVKLVDLASWTKNPLGFTISVTDGNVTHDVRIDNDINLVNMDAPSGFFDLTGIGSQFDASTPFNSGYQLMPRYADDINPYNPSGNVYPKATIDEVSNINNLGIPEKTGFRYELEGVVHGIDINGNIGIQFTIIDQTGGITVFNNTKSFGYTVKEGDKITVQGRIDQFRGLTQIIADTILNIRTNNTLVQPRTVSQLDESTESELIEMRNLTIVDISEWKGNGTSFNVRVTDGIKEFILRIDDNCDLANMQAATNKIHLKGLGSQFDDTEPYLDGYQILPRYALDIQWLSSTNQESENQIILISNPVQQQLSLEGDLTNYPQYSIISHSGKVVESNTLTSNTITLKCPAGLYFLALIGKQDVQTIKFIKIY